MSTIKENPVRPSFSVEPKNSDIYKATLIITENGREYQIQTPLPENYSFSLTSEYSNPFNQPLSEAAGSINSNLGQISAAAEAITTATTGHTTRTRYLSAAVWSGASEFEIEVPFVLQAFTDAKTEVTLEMLKFLKLAAPSMTPLGTLKSPGPTLLGFNTGDGISGPIIEIQIGKFFRMRPCIITNITEDFDTQMSKEGDPIGAVVRVSLSSFWACTKEDLDFFFRRTNSVG